MADPRFFERKGPFALSELADLAEAEIAGNADAVAELRDVATLDQAGEGDITFLDNKKYLPQLKDSKASACILAPNQVANAPADMALLVTAKPYRGYARVAAAFYPEAPGEPGIHESASVHPAAQLGEGVSVGPFSIVEEGAQIGAGTRIGAQVHIGRNVILGDDCRVHHQVTLSFCEIGNQVTLHSGCRIGQRGFGFAMDAAGHEDVPQLGRVVIGDGCELGANVTVDRGAAPDTVIGPGCKIDNLVQIGHNVRLGRGCVIVSQAGVAGSSKLGNFVTLAAQSGIAGHLTIGDGAMVAAKSGVMRDLAAGEKVAGAPAMPIKDFFKLVAKWRRLVD